jgi:hypothetical protein
LTRRRGSYTVYTFLLSLPEIIGAHAGDNISDTVATILRDYGIADRIGYFVLDNADNNDTAVEALGADYWY